MTVYKAIEREANAASELAIALAKGEKPTATTVPIDNGTHKVPSILEKPVPVTKDNISKYFGAPDYPTKADICAGKVAANCDKLGL
jgi:D-xylose transport system substrate-binding protein